jgi:hypothetical protein
MSKADTAKAAAIGVGGLAVAGGLVWLLYEARKGISKAFEGLGGVGGGVGDLLGGAGDIAGGVGQGASSAVENIKDAWAGSGAAGAASKPTSDKLPYLEIIVLENKTTTPGINKTSTVKVKVVDAQTKKPVSGAKVEAFMRNTRDLSINQRASAQRQSVAYTSYDGTATSHWTVPNVYSSNSEDDADLVATKSGYNASKKVFVK